MLCHINRRSWEVSRTTPIVLMAKPCWIEASSMTSRVHSRRSWVLERCMARIMCVLDHLLEAGADAAHCAISSLNGLAEGLSSAPAKEKERAEEQRADGGDNNANDCASAETV